MKIPLEQQAHVVQHEKSVYVLLATLGLEIARCWNERTKSAFIPLTKDALRFSRCEWQDALRQFQQNGWEVRPVSACDSRSFAAPGFVFSCR